MTKGPNSDCVLWCGRSVVRFK